MTFYEYEQLQKGDAIRVKRDGITKLLTVAGIRRVMIHASDGNEYELEECEFIPLTDTDALRKLGFAEQFGMFTPSDHCFCFGWLDIYPTTHIAIWMDEHGTVLKCYAGLKWLHQAQHKFRMLHDCELKLKYDK